MNSTKIYLKTLKANVIAVICVLCSTVLYPAVLRADLEYCFGIDSLIADSPLIITGRVLSVELQPAGKNETIPPSKAEIKILEILKGRFSRGKLTVVSGPLRASASYPVHYSFEKSQVYVFVLPGMPSSEGIVTLKWGGSLLSGGKAPMVKARILRARSYRDTFLRLLEEKHPETYQKGLRISRTLSELNLDWPKKGSEEVNNTKQMRPFVAEAADIISSAEPDDIYAAYAFSWFDDIEDSWVDSPVWKNVLRRYEKYHAHDIMVFNRGVIGNILKDAGVWVRRAREYTTSVPVDELRGFRPFPFDAPESFKHKRTGEILTTEIILQFHCYDQVGMYTDYLKDFDLSTVNPERIEYMIPYLFSSQIKELNVIANKLIREIPGNHFTGFILKEQMTGNSDAWYALKNWSKPELTEQRLKHMLNLSGTEPFFWKTLVKGECFEKTVVRHAIHLLELLTNKKSREFKAWDEKRKQVLEKALTRYLNGAAVSLSGNAKSLPEYQEWYDRNVK